MNKYSRLVSYKGKKIKYGRKLFNECLPSDYPIIDEPVTKQVLFDILNDIVLKYPVSESMIVFDKVKDLGFSLSKQIGYSMSIEELYNPKFEKFINTLKDGPEFIEYNMKQISEYKELQTFIKNKQYYDFIISGARGNIDQLKQMVLSRAYVADSNNKIRPELIRSSLVHGLTPKEYFSSSYGCRKGLLDTAVSTSASGYITRQLIYSSIIMELSETVQDCGTNEYLNLKIEILNPDKTLNEKSTDVLARSLLWRYIKIKNVDKPVLITKNNYKSLYGKEIQLRSPIFCKSRNICKTCYGTLHNILHSTQIGVIATQAIGERTVQLTLRTFHLGGVAAGSGKDGDNEDIVSGMAVLNRLFHNPTKVLTTKNPEEFTMALFNIFEKYGVINLIHYEVLISSMMWYNKLPWRILKNRNNYPYTYESILQIPNKISWIIGAAFSKTKTRLIEGLIDNRVDSPSSISNMFKY